MRFAILPAHNFSHLSMCMTFLAKRQVYFPFPLWLAIINWIQKWSCASSGLVLNNTWMFLFLSFCNLAIMLFGSSVYFARERGYVEKWCKIGHLMMERQYGEVSASHLTLSINTPDMWKRASGTSQPISSTSWIQLHEWPQATHVE